MKTRQEFATRFKALGKLIDFKSYSSYCEFYLVHLEYSDMGSSKYNHVVAVLSEDFVNREYAVGFMPSTIDLKDYQPFDYRNSPRGYKGLTKTEAEKKFKLMSELIESGKVSIEPTNLIGML